jgi:hypothetical protein
MFAVASLRQQQAITAECWVKLTPGASPGRWKQILQWGENNNTLAFRCDDAGRFVANLGTANGSHQLGQHVSHPEGVWHHLAVTYDAGGGANSVKFYLG